jgi:hypothetical protein
VQLQSCIGVDDEVTGGSLCSGRQRKRFGDAGNIGASRPTRRESTVDLSVNNGLDEDVASQSDVDRAEFCRRGEQGGRCLRGLPQKVMDPALYPLHEPAMVGIVLKCGGLVE